VGGMSPDKPVVAEIVFKDGSVLQEVLKATSSVTEEAPLKLTPDGISIRALDLSEVSMVDIAIPTHVAAEFRVEKAESLSIKSDDFLEFYKGHIEEQTRLTFEPGRLVVYIGGEEGTRFEVPIFQPESKELPLPKISYKTTFKTDLKFLRDVIDKGKAMTDRVEIKIEDNSVKLVVASETKSYSRTLREQTGSLRDASLEENVSAKYDLKKLYQIISSFQPQGDVTLFFGKDLPLKISAELRDGIQINYYLASMIEA